MTENEILQSALEKVEAQQDNFGFMDRFNVDEHWAVRKALEEIQQYRAIGTVEEILNTFNTQQLKIASLHKALEDFKALKENQRKCEDCAGCTTWKCDCANERAYAIDEFIDRLKKHEQENWIDHQEYGITWSDIEQIAEQLKGNSEQPKTNADRIRNMSDEELADMLHNVGSYVENGNPMIDIYIGKNKSTIDDSFGFILEWLKEGAE